MAHEPDIGNAAAGIMKIVAMLWTLGALGVGWWCGWSIGLATLAVGIGVTVTLWLAADFVKRHV